MKRLIAFTGAALATALTFGLCAALFSSLAHARPHTLEECGGIAATAKEFATHRDLKIPLDVMQLAVEKGLLESSSMPNTYIRDDSDKEMMRELVAFVHRSPMTPEEIEKHVLRSCIKHGRNTKEM